MGACSRCGSAAEPGAAWCGECGLALVPPSGLPTPEAIEAAAREQRWIAGREGGTGSPSAIHPERPSAPAPRSPAPLRSPPPPPRYKPIAVRAHVLRWWLAASVVVYAAVTVLNATHLSIFDADSFAGSEAVVAIDERLAAGGAALLATFLVSTVLWLAWFHRAYRNLEILEPIALRFGTGWAVGAWFVPILNLFRPKQIANDIWRGTDPEPSRTQAWTDRPVAALVHWWWAGWLVAGFLGNLSARLLTDARTLGEERAAVLLDIAAGISYVVAGVLALLVVRAVTEREAARAAAAAGAEADAERVRAEREGRSRRRPAMVALTLAGAAVLVLSVALAASSSSDSDRDAAGRVPDKRPVGVFELRPGDCLNGLAETRVVRAVEAVPCEEPHQAEVLSNVQLPGGSYPGEKAIFASAERRCGAALQTAAAPQRNGPAAFFLHPTEQSWALGDREITCIATYEVPRRGALGSR